MILLRPAPDMMLGLLSRSLGFFRTWDMLVQKSQYCGSRQLTPGMNVACVVCVVSNFEMTDKSLGVHSSPNRGYLVASLQTEPGHVSKFSFTIFSLKKNQDICAQSQGSSRSNQVLTPLKKKGSHFWRIKLFREVIRFIEKIYLYFLSKVYQKYTSQYIS